MSLDHSPDAGQKPITVKDIDKKETEIRTAFIKKKLDTLSANVRAFIHKMYKNPTTAEKIKVFILAFPNPEYSQTEIMQDKQLEAYVLKLKARGFAIQVNVERNSSVTGGEAIA
ncbi:MAG: hypothetical protein ACI9TY_000890 [Alphaproteobacteria bacterium]|jgi:hypothetical protein